MVKALTIGVILSIGLRGTWAEAKKTLSAPQTSEVQYDARAKVASGWEEAVTQINSGATEHQRLEERNKQPDVAPVERNKNAATQTAIVEQLDRNAAKFSDNKTVQSAAAGAALRENQPDKAQVYASRWENLAKPDSADWAAAVKTGAWAAQKAGDFPKAADAARRVLEKFPDDKDAMGLYQTSMGRTKARAASAVPSPITSPDASPVTSRPSKPAQRPAADPYLKAGQAARRVQDLQRHIAAADKYLKLRDREGALRAAQNAGTIDPATAYQLQARILAVFKDFTSALASITKAIEALAGHPERQASAYAQRAAIKNDKANPEKNPREALRDAETALALDPGSARALLERGKAKKSLYDPTADADLLAALDRAPGLKADLDEFLASTAPQAASVPDRRFGPFQLALGAAAILFVLFAGYAFFIKKKSSPPASGRVFTPKAKSLDHGRYVLGRLLGEGGMGAVHEAKDTQLGRLVAVKSLHKDLQARAGECLRFVGEAKAVAALSHPNIVQVFTIVEEEDATSIVYERISGCTLHEMIQSDEGGIAPRTALGYARQIASALDYAHAAKVIHRDLKPANVMVTRLDGKDWLKVMDFGIAKQVESSRALMTDTVVGTPAFMAPEQEDGVVTKQSDQFALGVTVYEMLTRYLPFNGLAARTDKRTGAFTPPSRHQPGLPPAVDAVFVKVLDPDPAKRYARCAEFCQALEAALDVKPAPAA